MRRLICVGCGKGEDLDDPIGDIHTVQVIDLTSPYADGGGPDKPIQEDLCGDCRIKLRRQYFGEPDTEILDMPLMKSA